MGELETDASTATESECMQAARCACQQTGQKNEKQDERRYSGSVNIPATGEPCTSNDYSWSYDTTTVVALAGVWRLAKSKLCRGYAIWRDGQPQAPMHYPFNACDEWVAFASAFLGDLHSSFFKDLAKSCKPFGSRTSLTQEEMALLQKPTRFKYVFKDEVVEAEVITGIHHGSKPGDVILVLSNGERMEFPCGWYLHSNAEVGKYLVITKSSQRCFSKDAFLESYTRI